jgi:hypothetical protein
MDDRIVRTMGVVRIHTSLDGREKLCAGPGHDEPVWLPATEKYFYRHRRGERKGKLSTRCRLCSNWGRLKSPGESGYVRVDIARPFYLELVNRIGMMEAERRTGISRNALRGVVTGRGLNGEREGGHDYRWVQKRSLRRVMLELISVRRKGEVRHRDSISSGGARFGHKEHEVKSRYDLNQPYGETDWEADKKRKRRERPRQGK